MTAWNIRRIVSRLPPQVDPARHDSPPKLSKTLVFMNSMCGPQFNLLSISTPNSLPTFAPLIIPLSPKSSLRSQLSFWRRVRWTSWYFLGANLEPWVFAHLRQTWCVEKRRLQVTSNDFPIVNT